MDKNNSKTALVILAEGFEEIEAVTPIDLLRRAGIDVSVQGLASREVRGSHNILITADGLFSPEMELPDAFLLPGGPGHKNLLASDAVIGFTKKMFSAGRLCAAICAAPVVFGKAGILDGKKATCFPGFEKGLGRATFVDAHTVIDGTVITSRGAGTAVAFSLEIISRLLDNAAADKIAASIIYKV
jgi:4-methyl-5(b-hydroxyethyl)-thiazole monophosphate biosynthesis